jgi:hypothetical protein
MLLHEDGFHFGSGIHHGFSSKHAERISVTQGNPELSEI